MFIIELDYIKSLEEVEKFLAVHRAFLDEGYAKNYFIASGWHFVVRQIYRLKTD